MVQKYTNLDLRSSKIKSTIPSTRIQSWIEYRKSGRKHTVKNFILVVLEESLSALSCRQISDISGIEVQSLTRALQELVSENRISSEDRTKGVGNRAVIAYSITKTDGNV